MFLMLESISLKQNKRIASGVLHDVVLILTEAVFTFKMS
jgi:hypothetical protein